MSRNKIIKMVHDYTGKSYKACRAFCKYHHWNEYQIKAMLFCIDADTLEDLTKAFDGISKAIFEAGAKVAAALAALCDNMGAAFRDQSARMHKLAEPFNVNKEYFNFDNVKMSEVQTPLTAHVGNVSFPIELEPPDVNDPHTPIFAPYYASAARLETISTPDLLPAAAMREQFDLNTGETETFTAPIVSFDGVVDDDGTIHGAFNDGETI